jgi:hypothetical protein
MPFLADWRISWGCFCWNGVHVANENRVKSSIYRVIHILLIVSESGKEGLLSVENQLALEEWFDICTRDIPM